MAIVGYSWTEVANEKADTNPYSNILKMEGDS